ncbi:MAG: radical SAM protein, partial [Myxococcales bacterium]|nr:radical SAM protein [Myxococcales bacterium]
MTAVLVPQHFGSLLFERSTSRYLPFDHLSTAVLRELAHTPPSRWSPLADPSHTEGRIGLFTAMEDRGHARLDGTLDLQILEVEPPDGHLTGPLAVHLEIMGA